MTEFNVELVEETSPTQQCTPCEVLYKTGVHLDDPISFDVQINAVEKRFCAGTGNYTAHLLSRAGLDIDADGAAQV